jgi:hypothetical protein
VCGQFQLNEWLYRNGVRMAFKRRTFPDNPSRLITERVRGLFPDFRQRPNDFSVSLATEMKIVLINKVTGRYYHGPGQWVRRSDNALTFEDASAARQFSRTHHLSNALPVERLAPYVRDLLRRPCLTLWMVWNRSSSASGSESLQPFSWN